MSTADQEKGEKVPKLGTDPFIMRALFRKTLTAWFLFLPFWAFGRLSIAILPFMNLTGDTNSAYWVV